MFLTTLIETVQKRRYPVLLVDLSHEPLTGRAGLVEEAERIGLATYDVRKQLLAPNGGRLLGAFLRREFVDWMKHEAVAAGGALFINPDELIGSWSQEEQVRFFHDFLCQELPVCDQAAGLRVPMALASARAEIVSAEWIDSQREGSGILAHY